MMITSKNAGGNMNPIRESDEDMYKAMIKPGSFADALEKEVKELVKKEKNLFNGVYGIIGATAEGLPLLHLFLKKPSDVSSNIIDEEVRTAAIIASMLPVSERLLTTITGERKLQYIIIRDSSRRNYFYGFMYNDMIFGIIGDSPIPIFICERIKNELIKVIKRLEGEK